VLAALPCKRESLPWDAAFFAGQAFKAYRTRMGEKRSPLPDFYVGAHATISGYRLLTRDDARYRTYFPRLEVISPERD
jgi:predicted nucleic acid-binding protein